MLLDAPSEASRVIAAASSSARAIGGMAARMIEPHPRRGTTPDPAGAVTRPTRTVPTAHGRTVLVPWAGPTGAATIDARPIRAGREEAVMEPVLDVDPLIVGIRREFDHARAELVEARLDQLRKDTAAARARVEDCVARMDAVLDQWNEWAEVRL
jgi:hypothetical protein